MNCKNCQSEIDFLDCQKAISVECKTHLEACISCRNFLNERNSLKNLVGHLQPIAAPSDFDFRLRARIARQGESQSLFSRFLPAKGMALAGVAILAGASFLTINRPVNEEMVSPVAESAIAVPAVEENRPTAPSAPVVAEVTQPVRVSVVRNSDARRPRPRRLRRPVRLPSVNEGHIRHHDMALEGSGTVVTTPAAATPAVDKPATSIPDPPLDELPLMHHTQKESTTPAAPNEAEKSTEETGKE
jgi:hypothetical protein